MIQVHVTRVVVTGDNTDSPHVVAAEAVRHGSDFFRQGADRVTIERITDDRYVVERDKP